MLENHSLNFIEEIIEFDLKNNKLPNGLVTRFPPEPNGYLHLGHAKSIYLNFGLAVKYKGKVNLRFDDTNPETEETQYIEAIKKDIEWLGFKWDNEFYASDYFSQFYEFAVLLIKKNLAYVDDSSFEEINTLRGDLTKHGTNSPYRDRSVEENLQLFELMKNGKYAEGEKVLRAKIDMASPNIQLRDPILYRIKYAKHHRTDNKWCIYPMYDFAHGQSDSIEKITHSICTLEFIPHRPLYDWLIKNLEIFPSHQYEFARLNLTYTLMSKRKLLQLVNDKIVDAWDDPRMPTISGLRRRGYTPNSIHLFCEKIGVAKRENIIDIGLLEFCIREELNKTCLRLMAVLEPIKLIITNYPEQTDELLSAENNPEAEQSTFRHIPFTKNLYIEREDFMETPPKNYFRLTPHNMVRLKHAYIIEFEKIEKDAQGNIITIYCKYHANSKSGSDTSGLKVKGVIHWVSAKHCVEAQVNLYDKLFIPENPVESNLPLAEIINPNSLVVIEKAYIEPEILKIDSKDKLQFIRKGYFCFDNNKSDKKLIFNRIVDLKNTWAKETKK